jgi:hypothetical protein
MPRPTSATTLQRPDLAALAWEYSVNAPMQGFIGTQILPAFGVAEQSADYPVIPIEAILKLKDTQRTPRGAYNRSDYEFETDTYACKENGWEELVDDVERKLYAQYFDAESVATIRATDALLRRQEKRVADLVFSTGNVTNCANVSTEWSTASACTPRSDVMDAKDTLRKATGIIPNAGACSYTVFNNLMHSKEIQDVFQYTAPIQTMNTQAQINVLAQYFQLDYLLIGGAQYDSAKKGQSFSLSDLWDDEYFLLFKRAGDAPNLMEPCLGRTFMWTPDAPSLVVAESYRDEERRSDVYRVRQYTDEELVFAGAGYILANITA